VIDLPEIDAQHEEIFQRIESLKAACFGSEPISFLRSTACSIIWSTISPPKSALPGKSAVDFLDHDAVHRENLQSLRKAFDEVRNGARDVHSFLRYAEYWFERHISEEDKPFAASVRGRKARFASSIPSAAASTI
jgi:hemerythrin